MIVPEFWAEARRRRRERGRQVTVRRFGWSDESQEAAQQHAEDRVEQALAEAWAGRDIRRREPKVPYNGAEGVPIREELVERHGETLITRNSYGALCLNTPNVLFADVDFHSPWQENCCSGCVGFFVGGFAVGGLLGVAAPVGFVSAAAILGMLVGAITGGLIGASTPRFVAELVMSLRGGREKVAMRRIHRFITQHPRWTIRLYRTPNGFRLLAMHDVFDPRGDDAKQLFTALACDPIYVLMCRRQNCFRARLTPKPWRAGVDHLKPRPGVWPINPDRLPARREWVARYDQACRDYAACEYITTLGGGGTHPAARAVQQLHDQHCRATSGLPIA